MHQVVITIKNYRCFPDSKPARFTLKNGLTSFIGVNNVGKSSLLKFFYEFRHLFNIGFTHNTINKRKKQIVQFPQEVKDSQEVFCNLNSRPLTIELNWILDESRGLDNYPFLRRLKIVVQRDNSFSIDIYDNHDSSIKISPDNAEQPMLDVYGTFLRWNSGGSEILYDISKVLEVFDSLKSTFYIGAFRNAINPLYTDDISQQRDIQRWHRLYYDINIGAKLIQAWKDFKTGTNRQSRQAAIQLTEQIREIFGFESLEISPSANESDFLFSINKESYSLSDLGSGIAQFFVVLLNIAINEPSFILIDEPEINLHPSLQVKFLDILERYASNGVLYATHSVGLARHADQIYSVFKEQDNISNIREFERRSSLSELLGELSYSAYREMGFTKVLLVEGRTEIKVIQQFLRKYDKDNEFFVVSLGGSQYICECSEDELREFTRICEKIFALIDSEKTTSQQALHPSRQAFVNICENLGIDCHVLQLRATDNYFPDRVIKQIKGNNFQALSPYQKLEDATQGWAKSENWCFAQAMTTEELESTDLGDFIRRICIDET